MNVTVLTEDTLRRGGIGSVEGVVNLTPAVLMETKIAEVGGIFVAQGTGRTLGVELGYQF